MSSALECTDDPKLPLNPLARVSGASFTIADTDESKEFHPTINTALSSNKGWKLATIEEVSSTVIVNGFSMLSLPVQLINSYPVSGEAVIVTESPVVLKDEPALSTVPPDDDPTVSSDCPEIMQTLLIRPMVGYIIFLVMILV